MAKIVECGGAIEHVPKRRRLLDDEQRILLALNNVCNKRLTCYLELIILDRRAGFL